MMRIAIMLVALSMFAAAPHASARPAPFPLGSWEAHTWTQAKPRAKKTRIGFVARPNGSFRWNNKVGRWKVSGGKVWLLEDKSKTGTKWNFSLQRGRLVLANPEDFKYLGAGRFMYMRFQNPKLVLTFTRTGK